MSTCYNIGDVGPAGGLIFAVPYTGINQSKYYYEISLDNINGPDFLPNPGTSFSLPLTPLGPTTQIPGGVPATGSEWGAYGENVNTSPVFGDGRKNTDILNALPTGPTVQPVSLTINFLGQTGSLANQIVPIQGVYNPVVGSTITSTTPNLVASGTTIQSYQQLPSTTILTLSQPLQAAGFGVNVNFTFENNFGSTNPTLPQRDLAAAQCVQHSVTSVNNETYEDWFLPSREEIREAYDVLGAGDLNLDGNKYYWTSTGDNDNLLAITAILIDQTSPVIAPMFQTLDRSLPVHVRPVRRFICEDKGIDYDYRLNTHSYMSAGTILALWQNQPTHMRTEITAKLYSFQMPIHVLVGTVINAGFTGSTNPSPGFPNGISIGTVIIRVLTANITTPLTVGQVLYSHSYLGPVMAVIQINNNITHIVFGNYMGAPGGMPVNLVAPSQTSIGGNITLKWGDGDTAFLLNSSTLTAVPYNFTGPLPAGYVPQVTVGKQLMIKNNIEWDQFGTIDEVIDIATDPNYGPAFQLQYQLQTGDAVDKIIVFKPTYGATSYAGATAVNNWPVPGPNGSWDITNYPQFSFVGEVSWITSQNVPNPNYSPSPFFAGGSPQGNAGLEIGHDTLLLATSSFDTRGNDLRLKLHSAGSYNWSTNQYTNAYQNKVFNIKVYDQFEKLICDYDYQIKNANKYGPLGPQNPEPFDYPGCGFTHCRMWMAFELINVNYVDTSIPNQAINSLGNHIVDLTPYFGSGSQLWGRKGNGYLAVTVKNPTPQTQWINYSQRGNTLNLENWLGRGKHRATDPNNVPVAYNTQHKRFGWGVVCTGCGSSPPNGCTNLQLKEWMAEVPYSASVDNCNFYSGSYNMYYPGFAHTGLASGNGQGWIDAANAGCPEIPTGPGPGGTGGSGSGGPSPVTNVDIQQAQNCPDEYKVCFDNVETDYPLSDFGVYYVPPRYEEILTEDLQVAISPLENKGTTRRQVFANKNKEIETGPFGIGGYYPLYDTIQAAILNSPTPVLSRSNEKTYGYHIHEFGNKEYYMPNGLEIGVTQFHGDWDGTEIVEFSKIEQPPQTIKYIGSNEEFTLQDIKGESSETIPTPPPPPNTPSSESEEGGY